MNNIAAYNARSMRQLLVGASLLLLLVCPAFAQSSKRVGDLSVPRGSAAAALLPDGRVLITGGSANMTDFWSTAELYDPATARFVSTGSMRSPRSLHTATALRDGRVLIVGGRDRFTFPTQTIAIAEIYDPATGTFTEAATMIQPRFAHAATLLSNGQVLIAGGLDASFARVALAEIYDPATNRFTPAGSLNTPRGLPYIAALSDGRALVGGGVVVPSSGPAQYPTTTEIYTPDSGFSAGPASLFPHGDSAAFALPDGRVLVVGGTGGVPLPLLNVVEAYDPAQGAFEFVASLNTSRSNVAGALLSTGSVVIGGGAATLPGGQPGVTDSIEVFDPTSGQFKEAGRLVVARLRPMVVALRNGTVLFAGGVTDLGTTATATAEVWSPLTGRRRIARSGESD